MVETVMTYDEWERNSYIERKRKNRTRKKKVARQKVLGVLFLLSIIPAGYFVRGEDMSGLIILIILGLFLTLLDRPLEEIK